MRRLFDRVCRQRVQVSIIIVHAVSSLAPVELARAAARPAHAGGPRTPRVPDFGPSWTCPKPGVKHGAGGAGNRIRHDRQTRSERFDSTIPQLIDRCSRAKADVQCGMAGKAVAMDRPHNSPIGHVRESGRQKIPRRRLLSVSIGGRPLRHRAAHQPVRGAAPRLGPPKAERACEPVRELRYVIPIRTKPSASGSVHGRVLRVSPCATVTRASAATATATPIPLNGPIVCSSMRPN